jgi:hypothetical protein
LVTKRRTDTPTATSKSIVVMADAFVAAPTHAICSSLSLGSSLPGTAAAGDIASKAATALA